MPGTGWGGQPWGSSGWGGPVSGPAGALRLIAALAVSENRVQLTFSRGVYFSALLDETDASRPQLFSFTPNLAGPTGQDGSAPQPVGAAAVAQALDASGAPVPTTLLVTLDRPLTPAPSTYSVAASPLLQTSDQTQSLDPSGALAAFTAVYRKIVVPSLDAPTGLATRDIASPVDRASLQAANNYPGGMYLLGVPAVVDGDYATDVGLVNLKKRVLRRIFFVPGATMHLGGNYGAGALTYGKKLASAANRAALAAACEAQISLEPDVAAVSVQTQFSASSPGLFVLNVLVRSTTGKGFKLLVPVSSQQGLAA